MQNPKRNDRNKLTYKIERDSQTQKTNLGVAEEEIVRDFEKVM